MNKTEFRKYLETDNNGGRKSKEIFYIKNLPDLWDEVTKHHERYFSGVGIIWKQKMYNYINDIIRIPKCDIPECNNDCNFDKNMNRYNTYCSNKCVNNSVDRLNKIKETCVNRYGVVNPMKNNVIREKVKNTVNEKMNCDPNYVSGITKKRKDVYTSRYGVDNPNKNGDVIEKKKRTCLIRYGAISNLCVESNKDKVKNTCIDEYGVDNPMKLDVIKKKVNDTCQKKYSNKRYILTDEYINKNIENNKIKTIEIFSKLLNVDISCIKINEDTLTISDYCDKHSEFTISKNNVYNRISQRIENICTKCNPIDDKVSIREKEIFNYITDELNLVSEKIRIENKEIDVYISSHKLGIEYNGLFYHSEYYKKDYENYHLNKTNLCEDNGIQLLHVFEDEWILKKEIVKSIIKNKLGIIENKFFARKCEIREISDNNVIREFLTDNHIQGFVGSNIKIGLYCNSELVTLMTFGKKRIALGNKKSDDDEYEMLRFCNKLNTSVVGGASKLLNYFIKNYKPKTIETFADRRYSQGDLYKHLGFTYNGNTKPNYFYFSKNNPLKREHRFNYRKDILVKQGFDCNKTEHQIMLERGFLRIYDSGSMRFILTL